MEQTYSLLDSGSDRKRTQRLDDCRTTAHFAVNDKTRTVHVLSSSCKLRWCPMCARARAACITKSAVTWLESARSPKMLTLTLRHSNAPLDHQLNYLYQAFRSFRQRKYFHKKVRGGIWFFQLKFYEESQQWHPHLHCLIDSPYLPQDVLSRLWLAVTGHSKIVDIRQVKSKAEAAKYVARYAARPALLTSLPYERRPEVVESLHDRRIVGTWGTARSVSLRPIAASSSGPWHTVASYTNTFEQANTVPICFAVLQAWRERTPLTPEQVTEVYYLNHPHIECRSALDSPPDPQLSFSDLHPPP